MKFVEQKLPSIFASLIIIEFIFSTFSLALSKDEKRLIFQVDQMFKYGNSALDKSLQDPILRSSVVRQAGQLETKKCNDNVEVGTTVPVGHISTGICKRVFLESNAQSYTRYRISKLADGVHVKLRLGLNISPYKSEERNRYLLQKAQACIPMIQSVWSRYNIHLDLIMMFSDNNFFLDSNYDHRITLADVSDKLIRSSVGIFELSNTFAFWPRQSFDCLQDCLQNNKNSTDQPRLCKNSCENMRQDEFCKVIMHETGHMLSLDDEYEDDDCPDRTDDFISHEEAPWSIMKNSRENWEKIEFFPRHIRKIVAPLCHPKIYLKKYRYAHRKTS